MRPAGVPGVVDLAVAPGAGIARLVLQRAHLHWIDLAAACWLVAFSILAWRYIPYLLRERIDGRQH